MPSKVNLKNLHWLWLGVVVFVLDQWSKTYFERLLDHGQSIDLLPVFSWTLAYNTGAAFSFLHDAGGWQRWFFIVLAISVCAAMVVWLSRLPANARWLMAGIGLLVGGALGNVYDRFTLGYVIDFIHVHYQTWHFPAFNVADCGITAGAALLVIDSLFLEPKRQAAAS
ncbi:signal peptidase II [Fluviicoccus keumensis]|uniref:Lipoprotein signal peptidase n=1 Tax=Fluviicoccus keumensis TaxID=1435465 RepID=A0A4Q7ZC99_9GAMM|nr:signal peptidase II [Fluviicoccus keumensis]RZU47489.1 signal peptidase II [Fluviicoccus keumensis]